MMTLNHTQRLAGLGGTRSPITRPYNAYLNQIGDAGVFDTHPLVITTVAAIVAFGIGWLGGRHIAG